MTSSPSTRQRPKKRKKLSTLTKVLIGLGVSLLILIFIASQAINSAANRASSVGIPSTDYILVTDSEGVSNRVRVDGTVQPGETRAVTTHLTATISSVDVKVGDRVRQGQTLATMDTSALQSELDSQRTQLNTQVSTAQAALTTAQNNYNQLREGINNSTSPDILAALSTQRTANEQLTAANNDLAAKRSLRDAAAAAGEDTTALKAEVAAAESAQRLAAGAKADADTGVTTARNAANTQLTSLEAEVNSARTGLSAAETARDQTLTKLQNDINAATITAPIDGVVTSVAKPGAAATGPIVTIGNDSSLTINSSVRESDIAKIKEGNKVTFTAGSDSTKEYSGTVTSVSSIADSLQQASSTGSDAASALGAGSSGNSNPTFSVQITVDGDREGLFLGSKVKANIITAEDSSSISLPRDAVYTNDSGVKAVIVAVPGEEGQYTLEERTVETGLTNDVDTAITGGQLQTGDMVITQGEAYKSRIGEQVTLDAGTSIGGF